METEKKKEFIKRGYNFSQEMLDAWEKFHAPSKDYSPSAAGAFLIWMAMPPDVREKARILATGSNMKSAVAEINDYITQSLKIMTAKDFLSNLTDAQMAMTMQTMKEVAEKLSRNG